MFYPSLKIRDNPRYVAKPLHAPAGVRGVGLQPGVKRRSGRVSGTYFGSPKELDEVTRSYEVRRDRHEAT